jgi:hypothetical protein
MRERKDNSMYSRRETLNGDVKKDSYTHGDAGELGNSFNKDSFPKENTRSQTGMSKGKKGYNNS